MNHVTNAFSYKQVQASGNVCGGDGVLGGFFCSTASATPTVTIYDDGATGTATKIVDTFVPVSGQWYPLPFAFAKGLNVVISGTVSGTVGYIPG